MRWREKERNFVDSARVARVATVDSNGTPHNIPICPLLHNERPSCCPPAIFLLTSIARKLDYCG